MSEKNKKTWIMLLSFFQFKKIFLSVLFPSLLLGEIFFSYYGSTEKAAELIYRERKQAIAEWSKSADAISRVTKLENDMRQLEESTELKKQRNVMALAERGGTVQLYDDKIRADKAQAAKLRAEYDRWKNEQLAMINSFYNDKSDRLKQDHLAMLQFIVAPLLAIGLAYLSSRQYDKWRWALLSFAFVAQFAACTMTYHGAMIKFDDEWIAYSFSVMFFVCAPTVYHFGVIDFVVSSPMSRHGITFTSTQTSHSLHINLPADWQKAIQLIHREKQLNNGKGMVTAAAMQFYNDEKQAYRVTRAVQRFAKTGIVPPLNHALQ